ncbi:3-isopropylmalate dehydrogenase [Bacillus nakamurai]|uniref:3-isopropylmalate dehydrogenase n=1 Tax=Bacillus nakamurai TaxID=1793963 RepID=UPI00077860ED|nr:3-isopropylmalate dehydrogenase [Bacillus nakamurai]KXZ16736.1 3-isopropylmalate dehydrogenase [Bacillus nakamurai]MCC9021170.1 3-isopropylmalate dehydrogenase [Bacillus nakamurai]
MKKRIALLPGDGIGPEVAESAADVLKSVAEQFGHEFEFENGLIGGAAIDAHQNPLPEETVALCEKSDAILLGAVGGPKWDQNPPELRPEKGLLGIRKKLGLFANLRPVTVFESLSEASPLKKEYINGVDFVIVRELTGGLYFGQPSRQYVNEEGEQEAVDTLFYKKEEIERVVREAFKMAAGRKGKVTSVDKANVLSSSRLWRETANEIAKEFPDVALEHMLVDNAAMQLIYAPNQFDVIVTENMFGDILSDEASMLTGSLGMLPSASLSSSGLHLFEPVHGSAPDIAGKGMANPFAAILSAAMLLRTSFGLEDEARAVEQAVGKVLADGKRTRDIARGAEYSGTREITEGVKAALACANTKSIV